WVSSLTPAPITSACHEKRPSVALIEFRYRPCAFINCPLRCVAREPWYAHAPATVLTPRCALASEIFAGAGAELNPTEESSLVTPSVLIAPPPPMPGFR